MGAITDDTQLTRLYPHALPNPNQRAIDPFDQIPNTVGDGCVRFLAAVGRLRSVPEATSIENVANGEENPSYRFNASPLQSIV
jgi:hypothetical protein